MVEESEKHGDEIKKLLAQQKELRVWYAEKKAIYDKLSAELEVTEDKMDFIEVGHYDKKLTYESSAAYADAIQRNKETQKRLIQFDGALVCGTTWTINGSLTEGRKNTKRIIRLSLRAFNNECEVCMAKVTWRNFERMKAQIHQSFSAINKANRGNDIEITERFLELKLEELRLSYEEKLKKQEELELLREERAREREEMRAQKEYEAAIRKAAEDETRYLRALQKARKEMEAATAAERVELASRIEELEAQLADAEHLKERALSMAQQTRVGHVYVISNIGAFGDGVFKVDMTRRLNPAERVYELGGASVPFPFDVHTMIFSKDAPALERSLHIALDEFRVNRINTRKEFFRVPLETIKETVIRQFPDAVFIDQPDAQQYIASLSPEAIARMNAYENDDDFEADEFPAEL